MAKAYLYGCTANSRHMSAGSHATSAGPKQVVPSRWTLGVLAALVGLFVLAISLSAPPAHASAPTATVQNESSPPELHSGAKVNTTAVELLFVDEEGIDTSSIAETDFLLSEGDLSHVSVASVGANATVTVVLADPIDSEELTVGLRSDSDIQDVTGTRISMETGAPTVTIAGMDGVPPQVLGASVSDAIGGPAEIRFNFDEPPTELRVQITGSGETTLDIDDFENTQSNVYAAEYEPPESGEYTVTLSRVGDSSGNTDDPNITRTVQASRASPEAAIGIDIGASQGFSVTFDASQSRGERLTYTWDFDDGTTGSGVRVSHQFEPGRYNVTLTVRDEFGNTGTDTVELNLTKGLGDGESEDSTNGREDPTVLVTRDESIDSGTTLVSVAGAPAAEAVDITTDDGTQLAATDIVSLDRMAVTPAVATSFSLAVSSLTASDIAGAADAETAPLGGFSVISDLSETDLTTAELTATVDAETLDARSIDPSNVTLRRAVDGEWTELDTTLEGESGDAYRYTATTPGFSRFAVVGERNDSGGADSETDPPDDGPDDENDPPDNETDTGADIVLTNTTLAATELSPGMAIEVTVTAENQGTEPEIFRPSLELNGEVVTVHEGLELGAGETQTASLNTTAQETGTRTVAVNGTTVGDVTVSDNSTENGTGNDDYEYNNDVFTVTAVNLSQTSIGTNETVRIEGNVRNDGEETANFLAEIMVDGEVVDTVEVPQVPAGTGIPIPSVEQRFEEAGTYNISVNGVQTEQQLSVGQSGGGFFSFLPLGILPLGILRTVLTFVGLPLLFLYLVLKAVAFYLGY